jgi:hypothetical protein
MTTILAYFDPGSGSMLVQAIAGGAAGLLVFGKYLWDSFLARSGTTRQQTFGDDVPAMSNASSGEIPIHR